MFSIKLKLSSVLTEEQIFTLGESLNGIAVSHSAIMKENPDFWHVQWLSEERPDEDEITNRFLIQSRMMEMEEPLDLQAYHWDIEELGDKNWLEECYKGFEPFSVGSLFIHGSHYKGDVPDDQISMQIDAATAFGTGEHATTKGCLEAMIQMKDAGMCPWNVLDMGTGSGILSVAAWKLWQTPVLGVDMDPESVRVATHHAELNDVPMGDGKVEFEKGDSVQAVKIQKRMPFDLIIANILSEPLKTLAPGFKDISDEGAYLILSGMVADKALAVREKYRELGFKMENQIRDGNWVTLVMKKV